MGSTKEQRKDVMGKASSVPEGGALQALLKDLDFLLHPMGSCWSVCREAIRGLFAIVPVRDGGGLDQGTSNGIHKITFRLFSTIVIFP